MFMLQTTQSSVLIFCGLNKQVLIRQFCRIPATMHGNTYTGLAHGQIKLLKFGYALHVTNVPSYRLDKNPIVRQGNAALNQETNQPVALNSCQASHISYLNVIPYLNQNVKMV